MKRGLLSVAVLAAGVVAGSAAEEFVFRRTFRVDDPESGEPFGCIRGRMLDVRASDGTAIAAETFGDDGAPAIVFAHGYTLSRDLWHYQVRDLSSRFRIITYDARGHGGSGRVSGPDRDTSFTVDVLAHDMHAVLEQAGVRSCIIVGHSMGGMTLLQFAKSFPDELGTRVRGLVLENTAFTGALATWSENGVRYRPLHSAVAATLEYAAASESIGALARWPSNDLALFLSRLGFGRSPSPSHVTFVHEMMRRTPGDTLAAVMAGIHKWDVADSVSAIDVPAVIMAGEKDAVTPPFLSRAMARRIPASELVMLPGTGHNSMLERHAEVSGRVGAFAQRVLLRDRAPL